MGEGRVAIGVFLKDGVYQRGAKEEEEDAISDQVHPIGHREDITESWLAHQGHLIEEDNVGAASFGVGGGRDCNIERVVIDRGNYIELFIPPVEGCRKGVPIPVFLRLVELGPRRRKPFDLVPSDREEHTEEGHVPGLRSTPRSIETDFPFFENDKNIFELPGVEGHFVFVEIAESHDIDDPRNIKVGHVEDNIRDGFEFDYFNSPTKSGFSTRTSRAGLCASMILYWNNIDSTFPRKALSSAKSLSSFSIILVFS